MNNQFKQFSELHRSTEPLLIGNAWNVQSLRILEKLNYKAIATSSAAVAETLGYSDGEMMSFDEYLFVIQHMTRATSLPVSVDMEAGYGNDAITVIKNAERLIEAGAVGINIEDTRVAEGKRTLTAAHDFAALLKALAVAVGDRLFINVRCDAFLLGLDNARQEAISRAKIFQATGVHGLFFPCITAESDIKEVVAAASLPVNVMCMPGLPSFATLKTLGVRRISLGNFVNKWLYQKMESEMQTIANDGDFSSLFR